MHHRSLQDFLNSSRDSLRIGPVAVILVEDLIEADSTIRHHLSLGFRQVLVFAPHVLDLPPALSETVHRIDHDMMQDQATQTVINSLIRAAPGTWFYYCYNAEYLFFPFCETRTIGEMLAYHGEEQRDAVLSYVVDLYAGELGDHPDGVALEDAYLDRSGYYALARQGEDGHPRERQLNFFGGLRWRYEEHIPERRRRIDRIAIFRAKEGLRLTADHTFNDEEYNTYSCPWHHNITTAIASFRTAKALKMNSGSTFDIDTFHWHNSVPFEWHSQQLLDMGLMEPGQWF